MATAAAAIEPAAAARLVASLADDPLAVGFEAAALADAADATVTVAAPAGAAGSVTGDDDETSAAAATPDDDNPDADAAGGDARAELLAAQICALLSLPLGGGLPDSLEALPPSVRVVV